MVQEGAQETLADGSDSRGRDEDWHHADVVCGGFPCQDISNAGDGAGITGTRSGLWSYLCGAIRMVRPKYAIVENVAALLSNGMGTVLGDLASIGYDTEWNCIPASAVGAEHERDRVWIVAYPDTVRELQQEGSQQNERGRSGDGVEADASAADEARYQGRVQTGENGKDVAGIGPRLRLALNDENTAPREYWNHKPVLGRGIHGVSDRVDRIAALGNSVYPKIPEIIGRAIKGLNV